MLKATYAVTFEEREFAGYPAAQAWLMDKATAQGEPYADKKLEWRRHDPAAEGDPSQLRSRRRRRHRAFLVLVFEEDYGPDYDGPEVTIGTIYNAESDAPAGLAQAYRPRPRRKAQ